MSVFFDTNVLFYLVDGNAPAKRARAQELFAAHSRAGDLVLSTQVLVELYSALTRKGVRSAADALELVQLMAQERVQSANAAFVERALQLAHSRQLSSWDALIVQAALDADCSTLLTEDLQSGERFGAGRLTVVNPFALAAHEPERDLTPTMPPATAPASSSRSRRGGGKPA
jgi:predicted nucleic acid-binding protein